MHIHTVTSGSIKSSVFKLCLNVLKKCSVEQGMQDNNQMLCSDLRWTVIADKELTLLTNRRVQQRFPPSEVKTRSHKVLCQWYLFVSCQRPLHLHNSKQPLSNNYSRDSLHMYNKAWRRPTQCNGTEIKNVYQSTSPQYISSTSVQYYDQGRYVRTVHTRPVSVIVILHTCTQPYVGGTYRPYIQVDCIGLIGW